MTLAIHLAARNDLPAIIQFLVYHGVDVNSADNGIRLAPLHISVIQRHLGATKALLINGADVNLKANFDFSPLHIAVGKHSNEEIVFWLVNKGAQINAKNTQGQTPLHTAIAARYHGPKDYAHRDMIGWLMEKGANPYIKDKDGKTPYDIAQDNRKQHLGVARLLKAYRAYNGLIIMTGSSSTKRNNAVVTKSGRIVFDPKSFYNSQSDQKINEVSPIIRTTC